MSSAARVRTDPRISRRRKAVAKAKRRRLGYQIAGAATGALLVWAVLWSPLLKVRTVDVAGAVHTTDADVARAAGLTSADHLLFVSAPEIARAVKTLPWVKSVNVDRLLPSTVRVRIVERKPAMVLAGASETWILDSTGRVLEAGGGARGLPTLAATDTAGLAPGDTVYQLAVRAAVRALGSMPQELRDKVKAVFAPTSERVSFTLEGGVSVRYGAAEELGDKHEVVLAILERLKATGSEASYIDVRVPSNPAVAMPGVESTDVTDEIPETPVDAVVTTDETTVIDGTATESVTTETDTTTTETSETD